MVSYRIRFYGYPWYDWHSTYMPSILIIISDIIIYIIYSQGIMNTNSLRLYLKIILIAFNKKLLEAEITGLIKFLLNALVSQRLPKITEDSGRTLSLPFCSI